MELKQTLNTIRIGQRLRLNRTFYGIETNLPACVNLKRLVLIVPFMELKPNVTSLVPVRESVLIVPFMELKH